MTMRRYWYYPGCSGHASARDYQRSVALISPALGLDLVEVEDWNCCGTTAMTSVEPRLSVVLSARNLALAEEAGGRADLVVTCNSCYAILRRAQEQYARRREVRAEVDEALAGIGRRYSGTVRVRHLLEVLVRDVGLDALRERVRRPLSGLRLAPYYGCLLGRPRNDFEDPEEPLSMDRLLEATGATVVRFDRKSKCCGGALITTHEEAALELVREVLSEAAAREARAVVTACPMCQFNLDAYQAKVNAAFGTRLRLPVLYFSQVLGLSLGFGASELGLGQRFVPVGGVGKL